MTGRTKVMRRCLKTKNGRAGMILE